MRRNLRGNLKMNHNLKTGYFITSVAVLAFASSASHADGTAASATQVSGTQLACGEGPDRQTELFGNYFKLVGNGMFLYDDKTQSAADAIVPEAGADRGAGKPMLTVPPGASDIAYVKNSKKMGGWVYCPLDSVKNDPALLTKLLSTDSEDDRCTPASKVNLTYTPDPKNPDPSKDNKIMAKLYLNADGSAQIRTCTSSDPNCPYPVSATAPQGANIKTDPSGKLSATVSCPTSSGSVVAQSFQQNIGSGTTPSVKTTIDAGKLTQ
jgi:hypothetical protein